MPGGKAGGGGHSSGGGRIGGGGRSGGSRPSGSRPSGGYSGGFGSSGSSFWQGMLFGSMMSNQNRPNSYQGTPYQTGYNTQQGPFHQQPTFHQTQQQQQYQQAKESYYKQRRSSGIGCITAIIILFVIFAVFAFMGSTSSSIPKSTVSRTKLDAKYVTRTAFYEDSTGWITSSSKLEKGLKAFYQETGVQPYLYVTEDVNGDTNPSSSEMDAFCAQLYDKLFDDEGHILVVSYDYIGYWYYVGHSAETVFDSEAQEIFETYIDHYADDLVYDQIGLDEFYSSVFADTGNRIMQVTPNYTMYLIIAVVILVILYLLFRWWQKVKEQKNKEAAHAEAILNADINDLANDPTLSDLEGKYDNAPSPTAGTQQTTASAAEKAKDTWHSYGASGKVDTYETAREQELKSPTLQDLEDKYK
ncbi:MAG: TPM domain-containing protein [Oscillospiraceae bacterium]|nr:TPM domain-containing protein [Oscillospiraceae bacterium]